MILCSHCILLDDRNDLATKGKIYSGSKPNQEARLRCPRLKLHLPSHRRLPDLQLIELPQQVQQVRIHNMLPPVRIPPGGLVWCFLFTVLLFQRVVNGDAAYEQLFSLHLVLLYH